MKIILVVGARPNFMKIAPIWEAIARHNARGGAPRLHPLLVHTGQHYDHAMSQSFFDDLELPHPDVNLGVGSGSHAEQTSKVMIAFEQLLEKERPDLVLVVGDVNSTMACTIAAKKLNIAVAHVEAGLRSGDMTMPEEINRKVTDFISDYLFTTDILADANLKSEGISGERIFFVGNVMIDTLLKHRERAASSAILEELGLKGEGLTARPYAVVTLHRPSNVDHEKHFEEICEGLKVVSESLPLVFPCHPRTQDKIKALGSDNGFSIFREREKIMLTPPLGYLDFLCLISNAKVILTDSGGIQEEATVLGVPCLTLRDNTERPITLTHGTNRLVGTSGTAIIQGYRSALSQAEGPKRRPERWDGRAAERIVDILAEIGLCKATASEQGRPTALSDQGHQKQPRSYELVTLDDLSKQ